MGPEEGSLMQPYHNQLMDLRHITGLNICFNSLHTQAWLQIDTSASSDSDTFIETALWNT